MLVCVALQSLSAPDSFAANGDYQQIGARFQQQDAAAIGHSVVINGRTVNAAALLIRLNDQSTTAAYSLDPSRAPSTGGSWYAVDADTPG